MKEIFQAFQQEVFRPLVTIVTPGVVAIAPYLILILAAFPVLHGSAKHAITIVAVIVAATFVGMFLEDLGTHIEAGWDDIWGPRYLPEW